MINNTLQIYKYHTNSRITCIGFVFFQHILVSSVCRFMSFPPAISNPQKLACYKNGKESFFKIKYLERTVVLHFSLTWDFYHFTSCSIDILHLV